VKRAEVIKKLIDKTGLSTKAFSVRRLFQKAKNKRNHQQAIPGRS